MGLACVVTSPAWADDGGDGTDGASGSGSDDGGDGGGDAGGGTGDRGGDGGRDNGGGDAAPGTEDGGPQGAAGGSAQNGAASGQALDRAGVLPLRQMLAIFRTYGELTIVDVGLVERKQVLVYVFKFIDTQGRVRRAYFDAHTGKAMG